MIRITSVLLSLLVVPVLTSAQPVLDETMVRAISTELHQATIDGEFSVFEKYMYPGSKITVDVDPAEDAGQLEVDYEGFMELTRMAIDMMEVGELKNEVLSVSVDSAANEATIQEKTTATVSVLGATMRDTSISTTTYGVVNGQIKVLATEDQLISSEIIE